MMTRTTRPSRDSNQPEVLHPGLAAVLRPELPSLAEEIILALRDKIPEYARPMDGPYGQIMRTGVEQALTSFVDLVADPATASLAHRDEVARMLGQHEAEEGRSLDSLQAAYRIGAHIAWQRAMAVGRTAKLSSAVMSMLADALFGYMNELAELSFQGYREARAATAEEQQVVRRRLLQRILDRDQPIPYRALASIADDASWPLPEQATAIAVQARGAVSPASPEELAGPADLASPAGPAEPVPLPAESDVLASLDEGQPHMLIPGEMGAGREAALLARLGTRRAAIGLTVPLADTADSLRWARQALALAESGAIDAGQIVHCEDHLLTLWLMSDSALAEQVSRRQLGALEGLTPRQRERLTETFGAWLETRGTAAEIADRLQVHPQTVRYRIRQLERTLGDQFGDPDTRFAMEMVLRAMRVRDRAARQQATPA
jgi:DNA-binding CsgD family transcriptional regulator